MKSIRDLVLKDWFDTNETPIECGIELELLLFDARNKEPLSNYNLLEKILDNLPDEIYRDHYAHQLEIRTKPYSNPNDIIKETKELYKLSSKEFLKHRIYIIPCPSIVRNGYVHCGLHLHVSYPKGDVKNCYYKRAMGMYPFILSLADHTKNFEINDIHLSSRMENSKHIGMPELEVSKFYDLARENHKYKDIIFSPSIKDTNRSRLKKPNTIEIRVFDTPSLLTHYSLIVKYIMAIASHIKIENPMVKMITSDFNETMNKLSMTRTLLLNQRYGINKVFKMLNSDVCEDIASNFNIEFPKDTQFEYREKLGLSADVNGFLSMAIKGGWL